MIRYLLVVFFVVLLSCDNRSRLKVERLEEYADGNAMKAVRSPRYKNVSDQAQATPDASVERKLIRNGSISFEVNDVDATKKTLTEMTTADGGYISSESQNDYSGRPQYEQVIRIPAAKLDEFIANVEGLARKIDSRNISTQDVTEEFIDVEIRLKTKKDLEARYSELLKQAKTVEDMLAIETQLGNVRGEIESMEGRLKYLTNQVSFSTLTLTYYKVVSGNFGFGYRFVNSFGEGWSGLLDFIIGLFRAWPFVLMLVGGIWLFGRWRRKRRESQPS